MPGAFKTRTRLAHRRCCSKDDGRIMRFIPLCSCKEPASPQTAEQYRQLGGPAGGRSHLLGSCYSSWARCELCLATAAGTPWHSQARRRCPAPHHCLCSAGRISWPVQTPQQAHHLRQHLPRLACSADAACVANNGCPLPSLVRAVRIYALRIYARQMAPQACSSIAALACPAVSAATTEVLLSWQG